MDDALRRQRIPAFLRPVGNAREDRRAQRQERSGVR
jgi:hypothetical protein